MPESAKDFTGAASGIPGWCTCLHVVRHDELQHLGRVVHAQVELLGPCRCHRVPLRGRGCRLHIWPMLRPASSSSAQLWHACSGSDHCRCARLEITMQPGQCHTVQAAIPLGTRRRTVMHLQSCQQVDDQCGMQLYPLGANHVHDSGCCKVEPMLTRQRCRRCRPPGRRRGAAASPCG